MGAGKVLRCYFISDSVRTHTITHDIQEHLDSMQAYLTLMVTSPRTNQWSFGSCEMEEQEYLSLRADIDAKQSAVLIEQNKQKRESNAQKRRNGFTVIEGGDADNNN